MCFVFLWLKTEYEVRLSLVVSEWVISKGCVCVWLCVCVFVFVFVVVVASVFVFVFVCVCVLGWFCV